MVLLQGQRVLRQGVSVSYLHSTELCQVQQQESKAESSKHHCGNASSLTNHSTGGSSTTCALFINHSQKPLMYPALLNQQTPLLYGCRRFLANGKIVLEQPVKAAINCGWKGWSPWSCWVIKQLETTSHYLHFHKAELEWHPSKLLSFHLFKPFTLFGFSREALTSELSPALSSMLEQSKHCKHNFQSLVCSPYGAYFASAFPGVQQTHQQWHKYIHRYGYLQSGFLGIPHLITSETAQLQPLLLFCNSFSNC